jgi:acetolactate synthase-1/2/3 large subunit
MQRLYTEELTEYSVASIFSSRAEHTTIVLASSGVAEERVTRFLRPGIGTRIFNGAALGSMGIGLSQGIGAALRVSPDRRVWIIEADGGLWMQAYGLASLRSLKGRTTLFILNNGGYGSIRRSQGRNFDAEFGTGTESGLEMPEYEAVCSALGLRYQAVRSIPELRAIVDEDAQATDQRPPRVVELFLEDNDLQGPSVGTVIRNGIPSTDNLEEIRW